MIDYSCYFEKTPTVVINIPGKIVIDNKKQNSLNLEVDYNSFDKETLNLIKINREQQFALSTQCVTYNDGVEEKAMYIKHIEDNSEKWLKVLSENHSINFSMIKNKIDIIKNDSVIQTINSDYSKIINFSLSDGDYIFRITVRTLDDIEIFTNDILVTMKTNSYSIGSNKAKDIKISFDESHGNFDILLSANSKRLYNFKVADIVSDNDNIFEFSFYNADDNSKSTKGKIGAELNILNDKQIEEIIKHPEQETLIKSRFVFDINEIFTTTHSKDDIGVISFPTIRNKIRDTYSKYYDLKCDVSQNYSIDLDKTDDFLVTDKFNKYPLFYKFLVDTPIENLRIIDSDNNEVDEFIIERIHNEVNIVYFNPLRNKKYYYILDEDPPLLIRYIKSFERYRMVFYGNEINLESPAYFADLMLKGDEGTYEVEIQFADYNIKTFSIKATNKEFKYLEDERVRINKEIISLKIKSDKENFEIISMICPLKNNRLNYSYFKNDYKDFVYIAKEVPEINIADIPESEISKFNTNGKYILLNGSIEEVQNGPLYLEEIQKKDIVFTDIEEWLKEYSIDETSVVDTSTNDKFFLENVINSSQVIRNEDK